MRRAFGPKGEKKKKGKKGDGRGESKTDLLQVKGREELEKKR